MARPRRAPPRSDLFPPLSRPSTAAAATDRPQVLADVATLDVALRHGADPVTLANLMPKHWADFIRNSDIGDVRPIGTTPLAGGRRGP